MFVNCIAILICVANIDINYNAVCGQYDSTLLHEAVAMSNPDVVGMLIRAGADVNSTNQVCVSVSF